MPKYSWTGSHDALASLAGTRFANELATAIPTIVGHSADTRHDAALSELLAQQLPVFNIKSFGGVSGGPDVTPAREAATAAAIAAGGGVVYYPAGFWHHTTQPSLLTGIQSIIYQGAGRNATHIVQGADGIRLFDLGEGAVRVQLRDMWVGSLSARPSGWGVRAISGGTDISEMTFERVTFQNLATPLHFDNVVQSRFMDVRYLQTISGATTTVVCYMIRCVSNRMEDWQVLATAGSFPADIVRLDSDCDTLVAHGCDFPLLGDQAACAGWRFRNSVGGGSTGPRLVKLTDCYVEDGGSGFVIEAARDIALEKCHVASCLNAGYEVTGGDSVAIKNSFAFNNGTHGIVVTGGNGVQIVGNRCSNNSQTTDNTYDGIRVQGTVESLLIQGNRSGDFILATANRQRAGIGIASGTVTGAHVVDNDTRDNDTAGILDSGTATYLRGNRRSESGAMRGTVALTNGTVTVSTTEVLAGDTISLTRIVGAGTTRGILTVGTIVAGTSFVIRAEDLAGALSADDDSTVFWEIVH